ncbi:MAG TPA: response regulator transcription factor [Acidimicrobiales bacterium]|nr:response regulator transcription factor [Acidimicrobiales bacterium]
MSRPDPIHVLVVDDHPIVRQGLRSFLSSRQGIEVVGEAGEAEEAVAEAARLLPDVVLLDLVMPRGGTVDAIGRIRALSPAPRVLVLTSFSADDQVLPAVRAGASGYVLKDAAPTDLEAAVRTVHRGGVVLAPQVASTVMSEVSRGRAAPGAQELTRRELEVLRLLARGLSNRELAEELFVSEKTVKTHVSSILSKLGLADRTQAALFAVRHGLAEDRYGEGS